MDKNIHIIENLNYYLNSNLPFEYAILLKGDWGSGKTFFIKNYIKNFKNDKEFLYVSLNGLEKLDNIYKLIFEEKYFKDNTNFLFNNLNFSNNQKYPIDIEGGIEKLNNKNLVIVFDDIERFSKNILIEDLLGFIFREFIEKASIKIILLSNEKEIFLREHNNYQKIKEKLIGKTFELQSNPILALDSFINSLNPETSKILNNHKKIILSIHKESGYNNLRILKQSIYDFDRLYLLLDDDIKKDEEVIKKFLIEFLIRSIEEKKGNPKIDKRYYFNISKSLENFKDDDFTKTDFETISHKYKSFFDLVSYISNYQIVYNINWKEVLLDGILKDDSIYIDETIKEELLWKKLYFNDHRSDSEFEKNIIFTIKILKKSDNLDQIKDLNDLIHIIGILIWCFNNDINIVTNEYRSILLILEDGKKYLDFLIKSGIENKYNENYQYYSDDTKEFKYFLKYIKNRYKLKNSKKLLLKSKDIFQNLNSENINIFEELLEELSDIPILQYFDSEEFFQKTLDPKLRKNLLLMIDKRYQSSDSILNLFEDFDFFSSYFSLLKNELLKLEGTLSYNIISKFSVNFKDILSSFKYIEKVKDDLEFGETIEEISQGYNIDYIKKINKKFFE